MTKKSSCLMLASLLLLGACNKKDKDPGTPGDGSGTKYIISATPLGTTGVADYLLTADDLTAGTLSTLGNGIEQDGSYRYYLTNKNKFFSLLYGQGNPGAVTTYGLDKNGTLSKISNFQSETVQVQAVANDDIFMVKVPRSGQPNANWYRLDADKVEIVAEGVIDIVALAANGERAHFTGATVSGGKMYLPYMSIKGARIADGDNIWNSNSLDTSFIAVYSYPGMVFEKLIKDHRTGFIGAYFANGLTALEDGDLYAFSGAGQQYADKGKQYAAGPSAVLRIKKGADAFDPAYFFDVQNASGGHRIAFQNYIGHGRFLVGMYGKAVEFDGGTRLAVVDVTGKTFNWVTGLPEVISSVSSLKTLVSEDKNNIFIGVNTAANENYIYAINGATAKAERGLKVEGGVITSVASLTY